MPLILVPRAVATLDGGVLMNIQSEPSLLSVDRLTIDLPLSGGVLHPVRGVSFTVRRGEALALVGESGCGKSLTAMALMRLLPEDAQVPSGTVTLAGRELLSLTEKEMERVRGAGIAVIFQEPATSFNPVMTVGDQVAEMIRTHSTCGRTEARARVVEWLRRVGIPRPEEAYDAYPHELSGGLKQRAMIAMALSADPKVVVADEPTTALDVTVARQVLELLNDLKRERGLTLIFITHDLALLPGIADRVALMYAGEIVEMAPTEAFLAHPEHPYAQALLGALPRPDGAPLQPVEGSVPNLWGPLKGCAMVFAPAVQANSVVEAIRVSFDVPGWIVGVIFAVIMAVVLVGGIKSISSFAEKVVPLMALAYVIGSIFILVKFGSNIPHVFAMIFEYAFTPMAATGGFAGSTVMLAIRWGLARGVYSNEAGTGMAPLAHSSSSANHPVKQGLWGISEVFVDTIIVCTMTALVVLCTGVWTEGGTGAALTATAFGAGFGNAIAGTVFVVAIITFFAFTTALVNVYYGEICMTVLGGKKFILPYRLLGCAFAIIGSVGALSVLWNLFDFFFGVCAVCNLVVCFLMRKQIGALINDYLTRLKSGKWEPTSEAAANAIPELWVNDKAAK